MKTRSMLIKLSKQFPKKIAKKNHDFVGLMVGKLPDEINKVLLCLDFDDQILDASLKIKPDLIITHHPFFFGSKTKILRFNENKRFIHDTLIKNNIALYSMHTNFDEGVGGMNDALAELLNLNDVYAPNLEPMMRIGTLNNPMSIEEFANYAKNNLRVDYALLVKGNDNLIKKVAIIGGGGSRRHEIAKNEGADIYISGDAPHYVRRDIILEKFNYLDVPHEVERAFMLTMENILKKMDPNMEITILDHEIMPKVIK